MAEGPRADNATPISDRECNTDHKYVSARSNVCARCNLRGIVTSKCCSTKQHLISENKWICMHVVLLLQLRPLHNHNYCLTNVPYYVALLIS